KGSLRAVVAELEGPGGRNEVYLLPMATGRATAHDPASFESLPVALMRLASDGHVVAVNRASRSLMGQITPDARLADLFEGLGRPVDDWVADAMSGRIESRPEVLRARRGDREVFLQVSLSRVV